MKKNSISSRKLKDMKTTIATLFLLAFSTVLSSQVCLLPHNQCSHNHTKMIKLSDSYYQNNFDGIRFLMKDLQNSDPDLYTTLKPEFEELQKRDLEKKQINKVGYSSGLILMSVGIIGAGGGSNDNALMGVLATAGGIVTLVTIAKSNSKRIKRQDILNFTNHYNQNTDKDKIEYELSFEPALNFTGGFGGGLAMSLRF